MRALYKILTFTSLQIGLHYTNYSMDDNDSLYCKHIVSMNKYITLMLCLLYSVLRFSFIHSLILVGCRVWV